MIYTPIIKQILIEDYEKNNDIYKTCELLRDEFLSVKFNINESNTGYEISVLSSINNNLLDVIHIDKK